MTEGGYNQDLSQTTLTGSDDGDLRRSIQLGSQGCFELYCQPCDVDNNHVEATFYCRNCQEYMCKLCSRYHKKFKEMSDHNIIDVQHMPYKPPFSKERPDFSRTVQMATHVKDIKVGGDIMSSVIMSTNQLLVADCDKSKVILVDTNSGRNVSKLTLPGKPWQVTRISDAEAAVTIPFDSKIVLLRTQPQLSVVRKIDVQNFYYGIAYLDNKFIVSVVCSRVEILDMSGNVLSIISADQTGNDIFTDPRYVTADTATGTMFVSDWMKVGKGRRVVKLNMKGKMLSKFTCSDGEYPSQMAMDTQGMVYVALTSSILFANTGHVDQLSANCGKVRTIIPDPRASLQALSYDEATKQLYIGQRNGVVKVYRLA